MKGTLVLLGVLGAVLAAAIWFSVRAWTGMGDSGVAFSMSWHGWLALTLGVVLTAALGIGLMALLFHSARNGYDDIDHEL